jgi:hypothetical protein
MFYLNVIWDHLEIIVIKTLTMIMLQCSFNIILHGSFMHICNFGLYFNSGKLLNYIKKQI